MSNHLIALMSPKGVGLRLFLLLAGAIVAIAVVADAWRLRQERTRVLAQLQREASLVTQAIQGQAGPLLHAADDGRLEGLLEDVRQANDAECVGAYSLEGRLVRAAVEPGAAERAPDVCAPAITPQPVAEAVSGQWTLSGTYNALFFAHACRSLRFTVFELGLFGNRWLWLATLTSAAMMLAVVYIPGWAKAFHVVPLTWADWAVALPVSFAGFLLVELGKWTVGRWSRGRR